MFWTEDGGYPEELFPALDPRLKNLAREKLAGDVCPVGGKFGGLTAQWAGRLGLEPGTAVGCGVIDSHAGLPGCGITGPGRMMLIIGTSSVQAALSEKPYSGNGIMGGVKNGIIPGFYAMESGLAAVGDIFEWFLTNSLPGSYRDKAQEAGLNPYRYLARLAERVPPGSGGLLALDWWTGNKTPFVDAELSGVLLGYSLAAKPEDLYRALVEATGFGTRMIMEYFEQGGVKIRDIVACGGIAEKDPFLTQIYADISDREIKVSGSEQTAALGAAMYASAAAGKEKGGHENILQAAASMSRILDKSYRPNPGHRETYRSLYREYRELSAYFGKPGGVMKRLKDLARQR
jgi:L-ribulokinase